MYMFYDCLKTTLSGNMLMRDLAKKRRAQGFMSAFSRFCGGSCYIVVFDRKKEKRYACLEEEKSLFCVKA